MVCPGLAAPGAVDAWRPARENHLKGAVQARHPAAYQWRTRFTAHTVDVQTACPAVCGRDGQIKLARGQLRFGGKRPGNRLNGHLMVEPRQTPGGGLCRSRLCGSTRSGSIRIRRPTPMPVRHWDSTHPSPPRPTIKIFAPDSLRCPSAPNSGRDICRLYRSKAAPPYVNAPKRRNCRVSGKTGWCRSCSAGPCSQICPSYRNSTCSPKRSACPRAWVMRINVQPVER